MEDAEKAPKKDSAKAAAGSQKQWRTEQCVAICDYSSDNANEISFLKGDVISVTGKRGDSSGFWEGMTTGTNIDILTGKKNKDASSSKKGKADAISTRGLFPTCMVSSNMRAYNEPRFCDKVLVLFDYTHKTTDEADLCKGDVWTITRPSNSPGWWYGVHEGSGQRVGDAAMAGPSSSSKSQKHRSSKHHHQNQNQSLGEKLIPINFVTAKVVVSGLPCQGNATNELPISTGDVLQVIRKWNDGWWEGLLRGKRGIFPSNLVHPNVSTLTPPLFCQKCKTILQYTGAAATHVTAGKCTECAEHERVIESMLQALELGSDSCAAEQRKQETGRKVNLFELVDEELLYGKKFLQDIRTGGEVANSGTAVSNLDVTTVRRFHVTV